MVENMFRLCNTGNYNYIDLNRNDDQTDCVCSNKQIAQALSQSLTHSHS